jgi:hypothetical protein
MTAYRAANLTIAFLLEIVALAGLCFFGFNTGGSMIVHIVLGIGAPVLAAVLWALFAAPRAKVRVPSWFRYLIKVVVFGAALAGLWAADHAALGIALAVVFVANTVLIRISNLDSEVSGSAPGIG